MFKRVLTSIAVAVMLMAGCASPQQPPTSEDAKRIEVMVNKAAALVERQGKAAFSEFRERNSEWWFGNTYLFAYDQNLNVLPAPGNYAGLRRSRASFSIVGSRAPGRATRRARSSISISRSARRRRSWTMPTVRGDGFDGKKLLASRKTGSRSST